jgi:AraC-like DNA-binding protein
MDSAQAASEQTVRVGPLVNLAPLLRSLGCEPEPVFYATGFHPSEFSDPDHRITFVQASQLLKQSAEITGCDHLGLLLGQQSCPSHLGIAGFLLKTASTVEVALQSLVENLDLHDNGGIASLDVGPNFTRFRYSLHIPETVAREQVYDLSVAVIFQMMRMICGKNWQPESISIERRKPADTKPYKRFFETMVYFDATDSAVTFHNHWLKHVPPAADLLLFQHLQKEADYFHERQNLEVMDVLPVVLRRALVTERFSSREIADELGLHERTLHRRLKAAGTSFRQQLDAARQSASEELLESTALPICEIASALGYADASGFIRAFRRWSGTSPAAWRDQSLSAAGSQPQA